MDGSREVDLRTPSVVTRLVTERLDYIKILSDHDMDLVSQRLLERQYDLSIAYSAVWRDRTPSREGERMILLAQIVEQQFLNTDALLIMRGCKNLD